METACPGSEENLVPFGFDLGVGLGCPLPGLTVAEEEVGVGVGSLSFEVMVDVEVDRCVEVPALSPCPFLLSLSYFAQEAEVTDWDKSPAL